MRSILLGSRTRQTRGPDRISRRRAVWIVGCQRLTADIASRLPQCHRPPQILHLSDTEMSGGAARAAYHLHTAFQQAACLNMVVRNKVVRRRDRLPCISTRGCGDVGDSSDSSFRGVLCGRSRRTCSTSTSSTISRSTPRARFRVVCGAVYLHHAPRFLSTRHIRHLSLFYGCPSSRSSTATRRLRAGATSLSAASASLRRAAGVRSSRSRPSTTRLGRSGSESTTSFSTCRSPSSRRATRRHALRAGARLSVAVGWRSYPTRSMDGYSTSAMGCARAGLRDPGRRVSDRRLGPRLRQLLQGDGLPPARPRRALDPV